MKRSQIITYGVALMSLGLTQLVLPAEMSPFEVAVEQHLVGQPVDSDAEDRAVQAVVRQQRAVVRGLQDAVANQGALNVVLKAERGQRVFVATAEQNRHLRQDRADAVIRARVVMQQAGKDAITGEAISDDIKQLVLLFPGSRNEMVVSLSTAVTALLVGGQWIPCGRLGLNVRGHYRRNVAFIRQLSAASGIDIAALHDNTRAVLHDPRNADNDLKDLVKTLSSSQLFAIEIRAAEELIKHLFAGRSIATTYQAFKLIQARSAALQRAGLSRLEQRGYGLVLGVLPEIIADKVASCVQCGV